MKYPKEPGLECDLIMKGGITSGIVYPKGICKLAERYRLRNIGGSSAGAIAAAAAGAAEYGRQKGAPFDDTGFSGLCQLPKDLGAPLYEGGPSRLRSLFQPDASLARAFDLVFFLLGKASRTRKIAGALTTANAGWPWAALGGLLVAALMAAAAVWNFNGELASWIVLATTAAGALALIAVAALYGCYRFVVRMLRRLAENGFGFCSGHSGDEKERPALTPWLTELFDRLAGIECRACPLTVGDLRQEGIEVVVTTTNLIERRPYRVPFDEETFFYHEGEFRELFGERVVRCMKEGAKKKLAQASRSSPMARFKRDGYLPFPDADDLPVIVGVRMSLSFPILLTAVPLYAVDFSLKENWESPSLERVWFSDGGICSNLPIHFFDSLLPKRPTFAVDLQPAHPDFPIDEDQSKNVWVPENNRSGIVSRWHRLKAEGERGPLNLVLAIIETMQTWNDEMQARVPGYRDRIARISLADSEGGLNLDMEEKVITTLGKRGEAAGQKLVERFADQGSVGWENHLWVRYRTLLAQVDAAASKIHQNHGDDEAAAFIDALIQNPPSYHQGWTKERKEQARELHKRFDELIDWARENGADFERGAPRPTPQLRVRPRF